MNLQILTFFALGMSIVSLWIHRSAWLWGSFLLISLILATQSGTLNPFSLIPIATLLLIHFWLTKNVSGSLRWVLVLIVIVISAGLSFHKIPGFCNWNISGRLWVNYDIPFIGLFILALQLPLLRSKAEWIKIATKTVPISLLGIFFLALLATQSKAVAWELKWPSHFFIRIVVNLIFVTIPEEGFFRGFIQQELFKRLGQGAAGHIFSVLATSALFALAHFQWTTSFALLGFVFLAGILYGAIYQYTRAIESSIFCHFLLNLIHMTFFSYHAM
jgi:membrane protease YdiL (CAAX protease family)